MSRDRQATAVPRGRALLEVDDLVMQFPVKGGGLIRRTVGQVQAVSGSTFTWTPARRWAWWGSPAAASPRPAAPCSSCTSRPLGRCATTDASSPRSRRSRCDRSAATCRSSSRIPYASLNPKMPVNDIVGEPMRVHGIKGERGHGSGRRAAQAGRPQPRARQPVPTRVLRRSASAGRHRTRPGPGAAGHHLGRAGVRPRRLGSGRRRQPARGAAGRSSSSPTSSSPTTSRSCDTSPTASRSCTSARSSRSAPEPRSTSGRSHPYTQALLSSAPIADPEKERRAGADRSRRGCAQPDRPALRVPVPYALLEGTGHLRHGGSRARGPRNWAPGGVSLRRGARSRLIRREGVLYGRGTIDRRSRWIAFHLARSAAASRASARRAW